ncbi:MAG: signal peptidase II [Oscillospiraceae bacterium]|nr:signal peptidase II [Oscillospiraceae bacterium]
MLCFVFSALVVALDQLFKHWIGILMETGGRAAERVIIPGILSLTYTENYGAAFSILSGKRWLLAAIMFVCIIILIGILLRYNEGFWGTLGLSAILGGAVGNLVDRVFNGYVVDMFQFKFIDFAIFNVADIFITLGGITFCVFFVVTSFRRSGGEKAVKTAQGPELDEVADSDDDVQIYNESDYDPDFDMSVAGSKIDIDIEDIPELKAYEAALADAAVSDLAGLTGLGSDGPGSAGLTGVSDPAPGLGDAAQFGLSGLSLDDLAQYDLPGLGLGDAEQYDLPGLGLGDAEQYGLAGLGEAARKEPVVIPPVSPPVLPQEYTPPPLGGDAPTGGDAPLGSVSPRTAAAPSGSASSLLEELGSLETNLSGSAADDEYDVDEILREYGYGNDT